MKGPFGREAAVAPGANSDFYLPNIIMPMLRRIFPSLIAHELVGVQAMTLPVGYAYAYRAKYGKNGVLGVRENDEGNLDISDREIGFNPVDTRYTGIAGTELTATTLTADTSTGASVADAWKAYCGT